MSFQWMLVATFLYIEMAIIFILLLSILKPELWRSLFQSRFMNSLLAQSNLYLYAFIGILLLFFSESVREFHKYSGKLHHDDRGYSGSVAHYEDQMRLFRGQRNFYISGFALFCLFVIKRIANLISQQAILKADADASRRQAENMSEHLKTMSSQITPGGDSLESNAAADLPKDTKKLIDELRGKNESLEMDMKALKEQALSTNREYDRLTNEYAKLQNKYDRLDQLVENNDEKDE